MRDPHRKRRRTTASAALSDPSNMDAGVPNTLGIDDDASEGASHDSLVDTALSVSFNG